MLRDSRVKILFDSCKIPVLTFLTLLVSFTPYGIKNTLVYQKIDILVYVFIVICSYLIITKTIDINPFFVWTLTFFLVKTLSNLINGVDVIWVAWNDVQCICMLIVLNWGIRTNKRACLDVAGLYFTLVLVVNMCHIVLHPEYDLSYREFFIGYRNSFVIYGIPALMINGVRRYDENIHRQFLWIATWIILIITFCLMPSSTSIIGLICLLVYEILLNKTWTRKILNIEIYLVGIVLIFILIVYKQYTGRIVEVITGIVDKNPTFTGRTYIWRNYLDVIRKSPLLGFGSATENDLATIFSGTFSRRMPTAHNIILNVVFQIGIIGLVFLILLLVVTVCKLKELKNEKLRYYAEALIGVVLLMSQFEAYSQEFYFLVFGFIYFYSDINRERINEQIMFA